MIRVTRLTPLALLAGALAAGACSDSNTPEAINPSTVSAGVEGLSSALSSSLAYQSLRELSGLFAFSAAGGAAAAVEATLPPLAGEERRFALRGFEHLPLTSSALLGPAGTQALFPSDVLGKTFKWDEVQDKYVVDPNSEGAPTNGVRFLLYLVNQTTHRPQEPVQGTGYVDLVDVSTASANKLQVIVKYLSQTIADYTITGTEAVSPPTVTLRANGYVMNETNRLGFDLLLITTATQVVMDYALSGTNGYTASVEMTGNLTTGAVTILWSVSRSGNTVEVSGNSSAAAVNCQIKFNGVVVATVTGVPGSPTVTAASGRTFTAQDLAALRAIFEGFDGLNDQLDGVFKPAALVF